MTDEAAAVREPVLRFSNLTKSFGATRALGAVEFEISSGEVHGLVGHNGSGKSTLIKTLAGYHTPDPGTALQLHGHEVALPTTTAALRTHGIRFVHQDLGLLPGLTVAENLALTDLASRANMFMSPRGLRRKARVVLDEFGLEVDPAAPVFRLSAVERANLAIVRSTVGRPKSARGLLVLDEPTAFLPPEDRGHLYAMVRQLAARGDSVLFVSHFMDEILSLCDRVSVLRDGRMIAGGRPCDELDQGGLVELVVGSSMRPPRHTVSVRSDRTVLQMAGFSAGRAAGIDLQIRAGEIVGVTGLVGAGYEDLVRGAFGLIPATGSLVIGAEPIGLAKHAPHRAIGLGVGHIPADRAREGVAADLSVTDNLSLLALPQYRGRAGLRLRRMTRDSASLIGTYDIAGAEPRTAVKQLSGGNAQKVLLAMWLRERPLVLLLVEPTQGVDIGARAAVYRILLEAARNGTGVLWASSDPEELATVCDRVLVLRAGRIAEDLSEDQVDKSEIAAACLGRAPRAVVATATSMEG